MTAYLHMQLCCTTSHHLTSSTVVPAVPRPRIDNHTQLLYTGGPRRCIGNFVSGVFHPLRSSTPLHLHTFNYLRCIVHFTTSPPTSLRSITLIPKGPCEPFGSFANFFDAITTLASFSTPAVHFQCKPFFAASLHRRCIARIGSSFFLSSTMHSILWRLAFFYIFFFRSLSLHQREPGGTRGNQGEPGGTRGNQGEPGGTRGNQGEPGGTRGNQGEPGGTRGNQGEPGGTRGNQGEPGGTRGNQGEPGGTRGNQGEPGGTRGAHERRCMYSRCKGVSHQVRWGVQGAHEMVCRSVCFFIPVTTNFKKKVKNILF